MSPGRARPWIVLASASLAGCITVGPDYEPPATDVPAAWSRLDAASAPAIEATAAGDLGEWWLRLDDPLLVGTRRRGAALSPGPRRAHARLREARARRGVAAADLYPSVSASAAASRNQSSEETGSGTTRELYAAGFDASWELDVFGGMRRSVEAAEADEESAAASLDDTQVSLVAEVAANYVEVRALQSLLRIARDNLDSQSETLQLTEWRAQAGLVSGPGRRAGPQQPRADAGADPKPRDQPRRGGAPPGRPFGPDAGYAARAACAH